MAWNGSNGRDGARAPQTGGAKGGRPCAKGLLAGLLVVIAGAVAWYCVTCRSEKPHVAATPERKGGKIAEAKPASTPKAAEKKAEEPDPKAERRAKLAKMTKAERLEYFLEEAKKRPLDLTPSTNRVFRTGTEQVLGWIFTLKVGSVPPPLPPIPIRDEAHMAEILVSDNPALEGDSESARHAKEMVELAKKELRQFVKQGGEVSEFMKYYHGQLVQAHQEWQDCQRSVMQMIRDDPDLAPDYIREVNKRLSDKGIKPVNVPKKLQEKLGLELEQ